MVPTGKRPLGRPRRRWEDNIRMDLKEIVINARNWVHSTKDRDYWRPCECGIEPPGSISLGVVFCICICFDGVVIAAQYTVTFSRPTFFFFLRSPPPKSSKAKIPFQAMCFVLKH